MKLLLCVFTLIMLGSCGNDNKKTTVTTDPPAKIDLFNKKEKKYPLDLLQIVGTGNTFRGFDLGDSYEKVLSNETAKQNEIGNDYISYLIEDSLKDFTEIQYNFANNTLISMESVIYCTSSEQQSEYMEQLSDYYLNLIGGYSSKNGARTFSNVDVLIRMQKIGNEKHTDIQLNFSKPE